MRRRAAPLILLSAITIGGIWILASQNRWRTEADIREAVFRYQIRHVGSLTIERPQTYYLSVGTSSIDRSPSRAFIGRFRMQKPPVRPVSRCSVEADGVRERGASDKGVILRVGRVRWLSSQDVEVDGGYFETGVSASINIYCVARRQGRWVVTSDRLVGMS